MQLFKAYANGSVHDSVALKAAVLMSAPVHQNFILGLKSNIMLAHFSEWTPGVRPIRQLVHNITEKATAVAIRNEIKLQLVLSKYVLGIFSAVNLLSMLCAQFLMPWTQLQYFYSWCIQLFEWANNTFKCKCSFQILIDTYQDFQLFIGGVLSKKTPLKDTHLLWQCTLQPSHYSFITSMTERLNSMVEYKVC